MNKFRTVSFITAIFITSLIFKFFIKPHGWWLLAPYTIFSLFLYGFESTKTHIENSTLSLTLKQLTKALLFGLVTFIIGIIGYMLSYILGLNQDWSIANNTPLGPLFLVALIAPVVEEIIFRKILMKELQTKLKHTTLTVFLSAILFSIFHFSLGQLISTLLIGLWLGWMMFKFDNIRFNIVAHLTYNMIGLLLSQVQ